MMNKHHWAREEIEDCFPMGAKVQYRGTTDPKLVGLNGVVTGYSQSGGIKVHFENCHAITRPSNLAVVPDTPKAEKCLACFEKDDRYGHTCGKDTVAPRGTETPLSDVRQPSHYKLFQDVESIEVIARSMTIEQFHGFCFGNILKYRLRAGKKSELATMEKDLAKASFYETLFEQHKGKCHA